MDRDKTMLNVMACAWGNLKKRVIDPVCVVVTHVCYNYALS